MHIDLLLSATQTIESGLAMSVELLMSEINQYQHLILNQKGLSVNFYVCFGTEVFVEKCVDARVCMFYYILLDLQ